jgi:type I protein arginine methyltransferase
MLYSLSGYGNMLADQVRTRAYADALRKVVRPGSVVVEIGTGPGAFAVFACKLGARRVYAIEPDPIIQVAREVAVANGFADRIEFIEDLSTNVTLPVQADVIVSDLRGVLPLFQYHLPSIVDARRRFLAPGGKLIPQSDTIWAAIVEAPERYSRVVDGWEKNGLDLNLDPARRLAMNDFSKCNFRSEQLLAPPQIWTTLDYHTIEQNDFQGRLQFSVQRSGIGHGIAVWFETCLTDGIGFSNAPSCPEAIYGVQYMPWSEPVPLAQGQSVTLDLRASLVRDDYIWRWAAQIEPKDGSGAAKRFEQSQLDGAIISIGRHHHSASDFVPRLSEEASVHRRTLELIDGQRTLEEIARRLAAEYPARFSRWQRALSYAAKHSQEHSL